MKDVVLEYEEVFEAIANARDSLVRGEGLSEDSCNELIQLVDLLPDKIIDEYAKDVNDISLGGLIKRYDMDVKSLKSVLKDALTTAVSGKCLDRATREKLDYVLDDMNSVQVCVHDIADKELGDSYESAESSVYECRDAIKNIRRLRDTKDELKLFVNVYSDNPNFNSELDEMRCEASKIIKDIESGNVVSYDDIKVQSMGMVVFVEVLQEDSIESEVSQQMLEFLEQNCDFPASVLEALRVGKYYCDFK